MIRRSTTMFYCCLLFLMLPFMLEAQASSNRETFGSLREFVQAFYDWYAPRAISDVGTLPSWDMALKDKSSDFDRELAQLLREDSDAQAHCEELVGLDFDPFLNSQDPSSHYKVVKITSKGDHYLVDVCSVESGEKCQKTIVVADLIKSNGSWLFVNFRYPNDTDLLTILKSPRSQCSKPRPSSR